MTLAQAIAITRETNRAGTSSRRRLPNTSLMRSAQTAIGASTAVTFETRSDDCMDATTAPGPLKARPPLKPCTTPAAPQELWLTKSPLWATSRA